MRAALPLEIQAADTRWQSSLRERTPSNAIAEQFAAEAIPRTARCLPRGLRRRRWRWRVALRCHVFTLSEYRSPADHRNSSRLDLDPAGERRARRGDLRIA